MKTISVLLFIVFVTGCARVLTPPATVTDDTSMQISPHEILANATIFGFGVKRGQRPTARRTDWAFESLLNKKDARSQFVKLSEEKNIYSKLYALCALSHLDAASFRSLVEKINKEEVVRSRDGCVVGDPTVKELLKRIENGRYDYIFKKIDKKNAEQTDDGPDGPNP